MNVWEGTHLFTWQTDNICGGNVDAMIAQAKALGVRGVIIKCSDGDLIGDPVSQGYMTSFKELAPRFKEEGFIVGAWQYLYHTNPSGEVDALVEAVENGADWIVLDAEKDVAGKHAQAKQFGELLRQKLPNIPVALSSYAIASYHPEIPFDEYFAFCDFAMPQVYWSEMDWNVTVAFNASKSSYEKWGKPFLPTGSAYNGEVAPSTPGDMVQFVNLCRENNIPHLSWWSWDAAKLEHLQAISKNIILPPSPPHGVAADMEPGRWSSKAVAYCLANGLMHTDEGTDNFRPIDKLTREECAQVVFNTLKFFNKVPASQQ